MRHKCQTIGGNVWVSRESYEKRKSKCHVIGKIKERKSAKEKRKKIDEKSLEKVKEESDLAAD